MSKLKELEKRLKQEPTTSGSGSRSPALMREAGRSVEAVELYRSVALAYRDQGRTQQAVAVCRSILEIAPDDVACNALLLDADDRQQAEHPVADARRRRRSPRAASRRSRSATRADAAEPAAGEPHEAAPLAHGSEPRGSRRSRFSRTG